MKEGHRNNTLRDALDTLNHVCHIDDSSRRCLEQSFMIMDFCLARTRFRKLLLDFHDLDLGLDTRLLTMLYFHIVNRCRVGILDNIMRGFKDAEIYRLDSKPFNNR